MKTSLQHLQNENEKACFSSRTPSLASCLKTRSCFKRSCFFWFSSSAMLPWAAKFCAPPTFDGSTKSKMPSATVGSTKLQFFCPKKTKTNFEKLVEANVWRTAFWPSSINAETLCRVGRLGDGAAGGDCGLPSSGGGGGAGGATSSFQCQKWPEMVGTCDDCHDNTTDPRKSRLKTPSTEVPAVLLVTRTQTSAFDVISYHFKRFFPTTTLSPNMFKTPWMLDRSIAFGPLAIKSYDLRKANRAWETDSLYAVAGCPLLTSRTRRVPRGSPAKVWLVACPEEDTSYGNVSKLWTEKHEQPVI